LLKVIPIVSLAAAQIETAKLPSEVEVVLAWWQSAASASATPKIASELDPSTVWSLAVTVPAPATAPAAPVMATIPWESGAPIVISALFGAGGAEELLPLLPQPASSPIDAKATSRAITVTL